MEDANGSVIVSKSKLWDQDLYTCPDANGHKKRTRTQSSSSVEDDVSKLMKEMGLPTSFKSTKKSRKREKVFDVADQVDREPDLPEALTEEQSYQIALNSWMNSMSKRDHAPRDVEPEGRDIVEVCDEYEINAGDLFSETTFDSTIKVDEWKVVDQKKKRNKKKQKKPKLVGRSKQAKSNTSGEGVPEKYWFQRYRLFSLFDKGIILDKESWYSVTPERIACHIAERMSRYNEDNWVPSIIIDAFCGSGGNTIQFANCCDHVIAVDIDPVKIEMAKHNAGVYGVQCRIDFIVGDYLQVIKSLKRVVDLFQPPDPASLAGGDDTCLNHGDVRVAVFMSPPWGGPDYLCKETYDLHDMTPDGMKIIEATRRHLTSNIAILLPRNVDQQQMIESAGEGNKIEIEKNVLNGKVKTITAYYGQLIQTEDGDNL